MTDIYIHPTATVEDGSSVGAGARIWHDAHIRKGAQVGAGCIIGKSAYIDSDVHVGENCKIQNFACVYHGTYLEDGVFVGPAVVFTNDHLPRAITPDGALKSDSDWIVGQTRVCHGASIGARAVVLPGLRIGRWALVGAGSVVLTDVADHAIVAGNPAQQLGWACYCGARLDEVLDCPNCGRKFHFVAAGVVAPVERAD